MKISEIYKNKKRTLSFEIFPPKKDSRLDNIDDTLDVLAELSPDTKIYSNLSPTMLHYEECSVDCYIGADCEYYHPDTPGIDWCDDNQPFGYDGVIKLFERLRDRLV